MKTASWVVVSKETGEAVLETFDPRIQDVLNTEKYDAVPILDYLASLNDRPLRATD